VFRRDIPPAWPKPDLQARQFGRVLREFLSAHVHGPPPLLLSLYCFCQFIDRDPMSRLAKL
jgi:hypothetical protein